MDPPSLSSSLANATSYLPSPADLLLAFPRLLSKAGAVAEHIDTALGKLRAGGSVIAEPTVTNVTSSTITTTGGRFKFAQQSAAAASSMAAQSQQDVGMFQTLKQAVGLFGYLTSKWAIATFATVCPPYFPVK
jgi:hypothetical protein